MPDRKIILNEFDQWCDSMNEDCQVVCLDALELLKEQEEQIKNRDESLEKAREEIKWLRGMLKEHEAVAPLTIDDAVSEIIDKHYKRLKEQESK